MMYSKDKRNPGILHQSPRCTTITIKSDESQSSPFFFVAFTALPSQWPQKLILIKHFPAPHPLPPKTIKKKIFFLTKHDPAPSRQNQGLKKIFPSPTDRTRLFRWTMISLSLPLSPSLSIDLNENLGAKTRQGRGVPLSWNG